MPESPMPDPLARRVEAALRAAHLHLVEYPVATDSGFATEYACRLHYWEPAVLATVGCWSPETRAGVLRTLLEEHLGSLTDNEPHMNEGVEGDDRVLRIQLWAGTSWPTSQFIVTIEEVLRVLRLSPLPADGPAKESEVCPGCGEDMPEYCEGCEP